MNSGDDLILRRNAILCIQRYGVGCFDPEEFWPEQSERFVIGKLNGIPAEKARPDIHGKWEYITMTVPGGKGQTYSKWRCSSCRSKVKERSKFCPECGSDNREI